jgi:hypothetical protein
MISDPYIFVRISLSMIEATKLLEVVTFQSFNLPSKSGNALFYKLSKGRSNDSDLSLMFPLVSWFYV